MTADELRVGQTYRMRPGQGRARFLPLKRIVRIRPGLNGGRITYRGVRPDGTLGSDQNACGDYFAKHVLETVWTIGDVDATATEYPLP